ncbi:MAG: methylated-DNA--[protein]-cysteine S-methyltransferase [Ruminococcus sp.]
MTYTYKSPVGKLLIEDNGKEITRISFADGEKNNEGSPSPLIIKAISQLEEYFDGKRKAFDLPVSPKGTDFQKKVWQTLMEIPYGETQSYKEIAVKVGNPKAYRAVGMANNKNPIAIVIPCHRVIGKNGELTGYAGGNSKKLFLIKLEQNNAKNNSTITL